MGDTLTQEEIVSALSKVPLFADLDSAHLGLLAANCIVRPHKKGDALFYEGDPGHALYIILDGQVEISRADDFGGRGLLATRGKGEVIGEMALLDGGHRSADANVASKSLLAILDREAFLHCIAKAPDLGIAVMASLSRRLREADAERLDRRSARDKVAVFLLELVDRAEQSGSKVANIELGLTHQQIGERLRLRRETVARALKQLEEEGAVRRGEGGTLAIKPLRLRLGA